MRSVLLTIRSELLFGRLHHPCFLSNVPMKLSFIECPWNELLPMKGNCCICQQAEGGVLGRMEIHENGRTISNSRISVLPGCALQVAHTYRRLPHMRSMRRQQPAPAAI